MSKALKILFVLVFSCGCDEKTGNDYAQGEEAQTNSSVHVEKPSPQNLSDDQKLALMMREALDAGDNFSAMRYARQLIDTSDYEVKSSVVTTLGWIGRKALPELEALMVDQDDRIRNEAFSAWEMAIEEVHYDRLKANHIVRAALHVGEEELIRSLLLKLTMIDEKIAVEAVEKSLLKHPTGSVGRCFREIRGHLLGE